MNPDVTFLYSGIEPIAGVLFIAVTAESQFGDGSALHGPDAEV